jgi:hypothetical protein
MESTRTLDISTINAAGMKLGTFSAWLPKITTHFAYDIFRSTYQILMVLVYWEHAKFYNNNIGSSFCHKCTQQLILLLRLSYQDAGLGRIKTF